MRSRRAVVPISARLREGRLLLLVCPPGDLTMVEEKLEVDYPKEDATVM